MRRLLEISWTGLVAVRLHWLRSLVCCIALVAAVLPYLTGIAISHAVQDEAQASAQFGADLYVSGSQFGRPVPLPLTAMDKIRAIDGVTAVIPRIVGEVILGKDRVRAILVALPEGHFSTYSNVIDGALPRASSPHELVVGTAIAQQLHLNIGSTLLPFYRNDSGERLSRVVGVFRKDAPFWQANLILTTFTTAETVFDQTGKATDFLVSCRAGYQESVSRAIEQLDISYPGGDNEVHARVTAREDLLALLPRNLFHRQGVFNVLFLVAIVVCIFVLLVASGLGLSERRREIGILKATGWQTDEILLRGLIESLSLCLLSNGVCVVLAWAWLRLANGYGIAGIFLHGVDAAPSFQAPFRLAPIPVLLAFIVSIIVVLTGTLYSSWRAATISPREAMR